MPEGPELHLASLYVNKVCDGVVFTGPVRKSEVSKNLDVPFTCEAYLITAASRGKEVKLTLTPIKSDDDPHQRAKAGQVEQPMDIVFRFGMSGYFRFTREDELPKHAHLRFYTNEKPCRVLSFVDTRRFGSWQPNGSWQADRGPCVMFEYKEFRCVWWYLCHLLNQSVIVMLMRIKSRTLQGEHCDTPVWPRFRQTHLWSPAQPKVLQWNWKLPEGWNPLQVMNIPKDAAFKVMIHFKFYPAMDGFVTVII